MPDYSYNKDYPFAAFITNLGKYNEGELVGEWVKFPTTAEELKEVFKRIGIGQKDDFGQPYEEWFITDYDCYVDGLYSKLGEYENLDELNYLASKLDEMSESEYAQFQAGMEMGDHCGSLQEIINLTENLDCYEVYPDIHDYDDLGRYYIEELDVMQVPEHLQNYIDYEAYGRDVALEENGTFTDQGYVRDTGDSFHEYYDGERGSIPDEYRVMTFQDDLPEEEKSEWAMDIAFDMDEFFRQNDPQYAAEHPEAHAAKEALYENLMAGRISALDEKLAALGQTQEDYLPSEIEKFKDATGYEEFLDFDPAEVKAALEDPNRSRVDEMLAAAEKAEREYAAEAAAYVQTPAAIVEQARAAQGEPVGSFSIYQLKGGNETLDYRFEPLDSIHRNGLSVKPENYELVYEAPLTEKDNLESIYTRFNVDRPADFTGHSLSVSDIVVLHQNGKDTAHYCDRAGFSEVPEFLQPAQKSREITERIQTPRGSFYLCGMTREQMEADGYGFHHASEDGKYLIMANGTQAYAVRADAPEKDNPLRTAEMTLEDDYGMIDGVINNGRRGEELEKAREHAERTQPEKKPSIRERLAAAKQECAKQQPRPAPEKKPPELGER
ncbi:antirestriction protein ArdA [Intestinimonas butyriciproducens]|uniref:antirestriction protein ArdA n=1 Tax=Intestinimonas butyriciproducens TaxID=1297617 RepID=UPI000951C5A4|nr:antirestriction protein ArdA [Intestinimonas butyriciproducens]OLR67933.1 antirestriction protein ArdA [Intestinimonas butyriciproducens]